MLPDSGKPRKTCGQSKDIISTSFLQQTKKALCIPNFKQKYGYFYNIKVSCSRTGCKTLPGDVFPACTSCQWPASLKQTYLCAWGTVSLTHEKEKSEGKSHRRTIGSRKMEWRWIGKQRAAKLFFYRNTRPLCGLCSRYAADKLKKETKGDKF
jgi:hypothetical protein